MLDAPCGAHIGIPLAATPARPHMNLVLRTLVVRMQLADVKCPLQVWAAYAP